MTAPVHAGDVLLGKYRVERVLGVGGMGVVVAATHLQLDQRVALKFMLPAALASADAVARFLREARAVVRLRGEHVARVLDVGTLETGAPYIVMEYLDGDDLSATLARQGTLPVAEAAGYVLQACEAMAEAHALQIVHRDLKPQNLFLTRRPDGSPFIKVLDFGISKTGAVEGAPDFSGTQTSAVMGSPAYMSPEQIRSSKDVDARTDIWALGVILYQLVSGRMPFNAAAVMELCVRVLHTEPEPLRAASPSVPAEFDALVMRCLRKDRDERYANIAELVADLVPFVPRAGVETLDRISRLLNIVPPSASAAGLPAVASAQGRGFATTLGSSAGVAVTADRPARSRWLAVGVAAAAVVIGAAIFVVKHGAAADAPATVDPVAQPRVARDVPDAGVPAPPDAATIETFVAPAPARDAGAPPIAVKPPHREPTSPLRPPVAAIAPVTIAPPVAGPPPPAVISPATPPPDATVATPPPPKRDPFATRH